MKLTNGSKLAATLTLEQVITAAVEAGATVSVGLLPIGSGIAPIMQVPERSRLDKPSEEWPGDPSCRSILASDASGAVIQKVFKDNPLSKWIITATRIVARGEPGKPTI